MQGKCRSRLYFVLTGQSFDPRAPNMWRAAEVWAIGPIVHRCFSSEDCDACRNPSMEAVIGGEPASRFVGPAPAFFVGGERCRRTSADGSVDGRGKAVFGRRLSGDRVVWVPAETVVGKGLP